MTSLFTNINAEKILCMVAAVLFATGLVTCVAYYYPYQEYQSEGAILRQPDRFIEQWDWHFPTPAGDKGAVNWKRFDRNPFARKTVRFRHPKAILPLPAKLHFRYALPAMDPFVDIGNFNVLVGQQAQLENEQLLLAAKILADGPFWKSNDLDYLPMLPGVAQVDDDAPLRDQTFDYVVKTDGTEIKCLITAETPSTVTVQPFKENGELIGMAFLLKKKEVAKISYRKSAGEIYKDLSDTLSAAFKSGTLNKADASRDRYLLAMTCLQSNLLQQAIDELWNLVREIDPLYEEAYLKLGDLYFQQLRNLNDALSVYQAAEKAGLESPKIAMRVGMLYFSFYKKELSGMAAQRFEHAAESQEHQTQALAMLGRIHLIRNDLPAARAAFERLTSLGGASYWLDHGTGLLMLREGQLDKAEAAFTAALHLAQAREDDFSKTVKELADETDKEDQLLQAIEQLSSLQRTIGDILNARAATRYAKGNWMASYDDLHSAFDFSPGDSNILVNLGLLCSIAGASQEAKDLYQTAEDKLLTINGRIAFGRAITAVLDGDATAATSNFNLASSMKYDISDDQVSQIPFFRGILESHLASQGKGSWQKASQHLREALSENPYFLPAYQWLADSLQQAGTSPETVLLKGVNAQPNNTLIRYQVARFYLSPEQKQYAVAEDHLERILDAEPDHLYALSAAGYLAYLDGNTDRALEYYEYLLDLYPKDSLASVSRKLIIESATREIERYDFNNQPSSPDVKNGWNEDESVGILISLSASESLEEGEILFQGEVEHNADTMISRNLTGDSVKGFVRFEADLTIRSLPDTDGTLFGLHVGKASGSKSTRDAIRIWVDGKGQVHHFGIPEKGHNRISSNMLSSRTVKKQVTLAIERESIDGYTYNIIVDGQIIHSFDNKNLIKKKDIMVGVFVISDLDESVNVAVDEIRIVLHKKDVED